MNLFSHGCMYCYVVLMARTKLLKKVQMGHMPSCDEATIYIMIVTLTQTSG